MNGGVCIAPNKCRCKPGYVGNSCHKDVALMMVESMDPPQLQYYWTTFRQETGEKYKDLFIKSIEQQNKQAQEYVIAIVIASSISEAKRANTTDIPGSDGVPSERTEVS
ncbi:hypothetical protein NPIL_98261 [Nephila pilipes]|uniref:EGF-like domain-containing protein n=1 Tax=Nephila pilipes TaxID=299642 RepID=A0A8X6UAI3_NEPPI|nr:hypothetical protein NPIL_98261 [Nephila pilipes]